MEVSSRFQQAMETVKNLRKDDPRVKNGSHDKSGEQLYANRMQTWLLKLDPNASEELLIAANCEHLTRWKVDRHVYPMDKTGYYQWRKQVMGHQKEVLKNILEGVGYDNNFTTKVLTIVGKENFKTDPDVQLIEDVACLVFLEFYFDQFKKDKTEEKIAGIVQKTWNKMSEAGRKHALQLSTAGELKQYME